MPARNDGHVSLREKMKFLAYETLYENVRKRLFNRTVVSPVDVFLTRLDAEARENNGVVFAQLHRDYPTAYKCLVRSPFSGLGCERECTYLVIAGEEKVVLMLSPAEAQKRNLPFLAVLEDGFFKPYLGCANAFWQKHIEPESIRPLNVLHSPETSVI